MRQIHIGKSLPVYPMLSARLERGLHYTLFNDLCLDETSFKILVNDIDCKIMVFSHSVQT